MPKDPNDKPNAPPPPPTGGTPPPPPSGGTPPPAPSGNVDNWGGGSAVTWETWQRQMAFDRGNGNIDTTARNSGDARYWYDNYVNAWNSGDEGLRNAIDVQHGFAIHQEAPPPPVVAPPPPAAPPPPTAPPPDIVDPPLDPEPPEISPPPPVNDDPDQTPPSNDVIDDEEHEDDPETPEDESNPPPSQDEDTNDEIDTTLTIRDTTPEDEVVDPATGRRYATPESARRAGITNWVWASDYTG